MCISVLLLYEDCWKHPCDHISDFTVGHVLAIAVLDRRQKKIGGLAQLIIYLFAYTMCSIYKEAHKNYTIIYISSFCHFCHIQ